ncbi:MAG: ABC transporter permease [Planctomycetaceae bacterium]|nr:ABC transporter permease [Planctomycetaceae bacterium]
MDSRKLRGLLRHRASMAGLGLLLFLALTALLIGVLSPHDPLTWRPGEQNQGSSASHWLGTDNSGRDILTRLFFGARISLLIGVGCVAFSAAIGLPLGAAAGYFGGTTDALISRALDILLSFPGILLAIAIAAPLGAGLGTVILSVGIVGIPPFARQLRAGVLALREREFVIASRALGAPPARTLLREILPNAMGPIIIVATLGVGSAILSAAGLSFIGLGVEAGTAEWGAMLHDGYVDPRLHRTLALYSGLAISLAVLGFNLFGDGLRDALDPRSGESR